MLTGSTPAECLHARISTMQYTLAAEEEQRLIHPNNPSTAQDLRVDAVHFSTSSWDQAHLDQLGALKTYHPNNLQALGAVFEFVLTIYM